MSEYSYIPFNIFDYKNDNTLSSFSLKETPLKFVPNLSNYPNVRILWDFGDGTTSQSLTGVKHYDTPGQYTTSLSIYDCFSNAEISTERKVVTILDFIEHTFTVDLNNTQWKNGKINGPIIIKSYFPEYLNSSSIFYSVMGSDSSFYFDIDHNRYSHLDITHSFFERLSNFENGNSYYNEILEIRPNTSNIYAKIEDDTIKYTTQDDVNAFFVGLSGYNEVYFKDDTISGDIIINLKLDTNNIPDFVGKKTNNLTIAFSATIIENDEVDHLSITSNGIDGEKYQISSFDINNIKFANVNIPFTIKLKDVENFSVKNFSLSSINQFCVNILSADIPLPPSMYNTEEIFLSGGSVMGGLLFLNNEPIESLTISASGEFVNDRDTIFPLYGRSGSFTVYPQNYITFDKINEDYDFTDMFKNLRFQDFLFDKEILFDDFIGSIFGDINSSSSSLGKKIHEKISNFVDNNQNIDRNEVFSLLSHMELLNVNKNEFDSNRFKFPESIKRLIDLSSIDKNKLLGTTNKFSENFDIKSSSSNKEIYGKNLGDEINTDTYMISSGVPIVALENFSSEYTLINTYQPQITPTITTETEDELITESGDVITMEPITYYMLSAYSQDWGWPLVLPSDFIYSDFPKYYTFFEYLSGGSGEIMNNTLLYDNKFDEINFDDMLKLCFHDTLYQSLSLVK